MSIVNPSGRVGLLLHDIGRFGLRGAGEAGVSSLPCLSSGGGIFIRLFAVLIVFISLGWRANLDVFQSIVYKPTGSFQIDLSWFEFLFLQFLVLAHRGNCFGEKGFIRQPDIRFN